MADFKIGCNFDIKLIDKSVSLNEEYFDKITEFYGSIRDHSFLAARPDFRLPSVSIEFLEEYVKECHSNNIEFNYTLNTIFPGSKKELFSGRIHRIERTIEELISIGINKFTVSNPIVAEIARKISKDVEMEVSTIAHIDAVTQIKYWYEKYGISKVCGNLMKNRNVKFLRAAAEYCQKWEIDYELMVNEFCGVGCENYATHCIYRDSCYICHATNQTKDDALLFDGYPMDFCISSRNDPATWLKLRFIRPEDIERYTKIGIKNFKITGRTGSTHYITNIAEAYMKRKWNGNLLQLWKPLETIRSEENELDFNHKFYIDNMLLDDFLDKWFNENHDCSIEDCGISCSYCNDYFERITRKKR